MSLYISDDVIKAVDEEIDYANSLPSDRTDGSEKTVGEYLVMLDTYLRKAKDEWTFNDGTEEARQEIRKIAAIALRCLEEHGAPHRLTDLL